MYDLHKLRLLRELKLRGTVTAVAEALSYSPSTVSQHLAQLESQVGVKLMEQVGRRLVLTPAADVLIAHTEAVMTQLERAEADMAATRTGAVGLLRVGAFQTVALGLVPLMLTTLREQHPGLRVEVGHLEERQAQAAVLARDFDLVVTEDFPGHPVPARQGLHDDTLRQDGLRLAVRSNVAGLNDQQGPAAAKDFPWVMEPEGTTARAWASTLCREAGFEPDVRFEATDVLFHRQLVIEGQAAALLPDLLWRTAPPPPGLLRLSEPLGERRIFTSVRSGSERHPAIVAARSALLAAARERA
ncbi:LysR family transcriptional regulator [Arthrobacter sp. AB6]|uniref:LysR family transcriptional regulator n=1 Tax=Arthrobacter sp. AB6 TaxID=2962570 RepID=UPI0028826968|nr:LysR family transcriptional regulator [Arthrobacter sp. AB6]MDT0196721.1 LysR family transcriptional regulator [Arthrobacter sp. AB6]